MNESSESALNEQVAKGKKIEAAIQRAVREAVLASAYAGQPAPVWRDGKVVWLTPDEIFKELGAPPPAKTPDSLGAA